MRLIIEIQDTGLGDPLAAAHNGLPVELFIGPLAFQVACIERADDA